MPPRANSLDNPIPPVLHDDQVLNLRQWAQLNNISPRTGRRLIAEGLGPKVVRLSLRKLGVRVRDNREWQQTRERA
jgi:predicted DNA-binding transcriptional regulator AlpA